MTLNKVKCRLCSEEVSMRQMLYHALDCERELRKLSEQGISELERYLSEQK